jgi:hypothetical protein
MGFSQGREVFAILARRPKERPLHPALRVGCGFRSEPALSRRGQEKHDSRQWPQSQKPKLTLGFDDDGGGGAFAGAVEHGFDIVAIGVDHEGGVIAGVVVALAGGAIVFAASSDGGPMEGFHHGAIPGLEGEVDVAGEDIAGRFIDEQLVDLHPILARGGHRNAEDIENGRIKFSRLFEIMGAEMHVVDEAAGVECHGVIHS